MLKSYSGRVRPPLGARAARARVDLLVVVARAFWAPRIAHSLQEPAGLASRAGGTARRQGRPRPINGLLAAAACSPPSLAAHEDVPAVGYPKERPGHGVRASRPEHGRQTSSPGFKTRAGSFCRGARRTSKGFIPRTRGRATIHASNGRPSPAFPRRTDIENRRQRAANVRPRCSPLVRPKNRERRRPAPASPA